VNRSAENDRLAVIWETTNAGKGQPSCRDTARSVVACPTNRLSPRRVLSSNPRPLHLSQQFDQFSFNELQTQFGPRNSSHDNEVQRHRPIVTKAAKRLSTEAPQPGALWRVANPFRDRQTQPRPRVHPTAKTNAQLPPSHSLARAHNASEVPLSQGTTRARKSTSGRRQRRGALQAVF
jgi:hypothetical protein